METSIYYVECSVMYVFCVMQRERKGAHEEDYFCLVSKEKITPSCWAHVLISRWTNGIRMGSW